MPQECSCKAMSIEAQVKESAKSEMFLAVPKSVNIRRIHGFLLRARLAEQLQQLRMNLSKCKERHQQWRVLISAVVSQSLIHFLQQGKEGRGWTCQCSCTIAPF